MTQTIEATYDGDVFRPDEPVRIKPNTRVVITVESAPDTEPKTASFLLVAQSLNLGGPPDWSSRLDEYLYDETSSDDE